LAFDGYRGRKFKNKKKIHAPKGPAYFAIESGTHHMKPYPFGNYFLLERLAIGGMAEVYLAKSSGMAGFEELVALKRILPTIAADDEFVAMFIDEAKIAGQLSHTNVARIFDLGKIENSYFIAMEYISGHDLRTLWDRVCSEGFMPIELACYVAQKICAGLDYAHRKRDSRGRALGIIHRDVSPQNVLMSYTGDIKVIDFGIAKAANRMVRTATGILKGKFAYMAPEQARGDPTDHRADIFAIGVIFYELLTGERAFKADTDYALLKKVREVNLIPPRDLRPEIPRQLEDIIYKAMSKDASHRYAWASALATDLDRFMSEHGLTYNKEELSAYLQRYFRNEYKEEQVRVQEYHKLFLSEDSLSGELHRTTADSAELNQQDSEIYDKGTQLEELPDHRAKVTSDSHDSTRHDEISESMSFENEDSIIESDVLTGEESEFESSAPYEAGPTQLIDFEAKDASSDSAIETKAGRISRSQDSSWEEPQTAFSDEMDSQTEFSDEAESEESEENTRLFSDEREDETIMDSVSELMDKANRPVPQDTKSAYQVFEEKKTRVRNKPKKKGSLPAQATDANLPIDADDDSEPTFESLPMAESIQAKDENKSEPPASEVASLATVNPSALQSSKSVNQYRVLLALFILLLAGVIIWATLFNLEDSKSLIVVTPETATIQRNGETICSQTPCAITINGEKEELVFTAPNYEPLSKVIGKSEEVVRVTMSPSTRTVKLTTTPVGAVVRLNGKTIKGETPLELPSLVIGDNLKLELELYGYVPIEKTMTIDGKNPGLIHFDFQSSRTKWSIFTKPTDAIIEFSDGSLRQRKATRRIEKDELEAVRVSRAGCTSKLLVLAGNGKSAKTKKVELVCRPFRSKLTILSRAPVKVTIDGVPSVRRKWVRNYPLTAGDHTITIIGKRGRQETKVVSLVAGKSLRLKTRVR
jgi:serine/threonine protein kinase